MVVIDSKSQGAMSISTSVAAAALAAAALAAANSNSTGTSKALGSQTSSAPSSAQAGGTGETSTAHTVAGGQPAAVKSSVAGSGTTTAAGEADAATTKRTYPRLFNKIVLTLENSLIPESKLEATPSRIDGLDPETEKDLRILGCELIQTAGILLRLPQVAMATGQVLFQRFFYSKSLVRYSMETVAMSCVCLASKIEEAPRRIRDVINVFHHIKQVRAQKEISPMNVDLYYTNLKAQVIKAERCVLKELGFCVHVKHPHKLIVMYLQVLQYEKHEKLMQMSWNFMNDSLRTDVFMRYQPETIACACIYLSARKLGIPLPNEPPWFGIFRVTVEDIIDICYRVLELYTRPKPNADKLDAAVDLLKKQYHASRTKTKEINTPPTVTTVDRSNGSHNAWGGFIQRAVPLPLPTVTKTPEKEQRSRSPRASRGASRSPKGGHSRSRTPRSRSATPPSVDEYKSRSKKSRRSREQRSPRSRTRSRSPPSKSKKKSRHHSRSPSSSPHAKHRKRKSSRERDYYSKEYRTSGGGVGGSNDKYRDKYHDRDSSRPSGHRSSSGKHHSYSSHRSSQNSRGANHKHRERDRERDRDRSGR